MTLLHPWAIFAGLAAIALPLAVHWLTRPRPQRFALSTVRFVLQAVQQRRAHHRLRDILILLLRIAAVLLIAWAFARPLTQSKPLIATDDSTTAVRVVIFDQSQSMAATTNGISAVERGRPIAARYLDYRPGLRGNLILAAARPRPVFDRPSFNMGALRQELSNAQVRPEGLDLQAALSLAAEHLSTAAPDQRRQLIIVTDFQRSAWASADFSALPKDTLIQLESVASAAAPPNLAILRVSPQARVEQNRPTRIDVEVGNSSPVQRDVQVELTIGRSSYRLAGTCSPYLSTTLSAAVTLDASGWQSGQARLVNADDALPADDARPLVLDVRPTPMYALITRQPSKPQPLSSHFLERALLPSLPRQGSAQTSRVLRIDPDRIERQTLSSADLIVLDHPGKLPQGGIDLLSALMRRGRPVLYVAAEPIDATNLKRLADAAGTALKMPVEFSPPPALQARRNLFLADFRKDEPPFNVFGELAMPALSPLRFSGGLSSRRLDTGLADDILATYSDRSACLIVTTCAAGALGILNADLSTSNLPAAPAFVPLLGELTGRLLGQKRSQDAAVPSGQPLARYLPADAGTLPGLALAGPANELGSLLEESNFILWRWNAAGPPGVYHVMRGQTPVFSLASAIPAAESDLRALDPAVLKDRLSGGRQIYIQSAAEEQKKDDTWSWLLVACTLCLLTELLVLKLFKT